MAFLDRMMTVIRYSILLLILWNIPSFILAYFSSSVASLSSYLSSILVVVYFIFVKERHKPSIPFVLLGLFYFTISSFNYTSGESIDFIKDFIRFMIIVLCAGELLHRTTKRELFIFLIIGGLSVVINAFLFPLANANFTPTYGRYSGFYLNPNYAGYICLIGFALSYSIKNNWLKTGGQLIFTLAGILTFSRGFIVIWLIINVISIYNSRKNLIVPLIGAGTLILVFALSSMLSLNKDRFSALASIFESDAQVQTKTISSGSRTETWALYTDLIFDKAIIGNGYKKMQEKTGGLPGIHNSFLMVFGESGIIPFLLMIGIYFYLLTKSFKSFKTEPEYFYLACVLTLALTVAHGYFNDFYNVLISMFVYIRLTNKNNIETSSPL